MKYKYLFLLSSLFFILTNKAAAQNKSKLTMGFGFGYGYANNDTYPVKFLGNKVEVPNSNLVFDFSMGYKSEKVIVRTDFIWMSTPQTNPKTEVYGGVSSSLFLMHAGTPIINKSTIALNVLLGIGVQESRFTYTQKNNNSLDSLNSGHTNELSMLLLNVMACPELELYFKKSGFSIYTNYMVGLTESKITNLTGNTIGNYGFKPNTFRIGLRYNFWK
jgi:hypothetical protein